MCSRIVLKEHVGCKIPLTAKRGCLSPKRGNLNILMMCLEDIKMNGVLVTDHMWVETARRTKSLKSKQRFEFTATVTEYLSLDGYKQVMKIGLEDLRNVKDIK